MAVHLAMDAYAHYAYAIDNTGAVTKIETKKDDIGNVPARYNTAKAVAVSIVDGWHYGWGTSYDVFYQPDTHKKSAFKMHKFARFCNIAQPSNYNEHPVWYQNRTP